MAERVGALLYPPEQELAGDPVRWVQERTRTHLWSKQREVAEAVLEHRQVAVPAAHGVGKSRLAAGLMAWWVDTHPRGQTRVVTTAPTGHLVRNVLWTEFAPLRELAGVRGTVTYPNAGPEWRDGEELLAVGRSPSEAGEGVGLQGIHAVHLLAIIDEAAGLPKVLWDAIESLATSGHARVLALGNPLVGGGEFERVCRPGSGWHVVQVPAHSAPAFTGEPVPDALTDSLVTRTWVEERARRWGTRSSQYSAKVLAEFPAAGRVDALIEPGWIRRAQSADRTAPAREDPGVLSVDVARFGDDESVVGRLRGGRFRVFGVLRQQPTTELTGRVRRLWTYLQSWLPVAVDADGVGGGVVDMLREPEPFPVAVHAFSAAGAARDRDTYANRRAEAWWRVRELFQEGLVDIDPDDDVLAAQLGELRWRTRPDGRVAVESKEEARRRGVSSPDRADCLLMAVAAADEREAPLTVDQAMARIEARGPQTGGLMTRAW